MSCIYVFLAEGFEEIEALTVVDLGRRAGIDVVTVSTTGIRQVTGSHNIAVTCDILLEETSWEKADMLVLPGGMPGTVNLSACDILKEQIKEFARGGRYVAAICAAPTILGELGVLEGRKACCYPGKETALGGAEVVYAPVMVDDNIITSRGMGTAISFSLKIVELLKGREAAHDLAAAIVYDGFN